MDIEPRSIAILAGVTAFTFLLSYIAKKTIYKRLVDQRMTTQRIADFAFWMVPVLVFGAGCIVTFAPKSMTYPTAFAFMLAILVAFIVVCQRERRSLQSDKAAEEVEMDPEQLADRKAQDEKNYRNLKIAAWVFLAIIVVRFIFF